MSAEPVVDIQGVSKAFNGTLAVDEATFSIPPGSVYGGLGPNGAGKTTTIRMVMRILFPDSGRGEVFGLPSASADKSRIG